MVSRFISEKELANTYGSDAGWQTVRQYREAHRLRENNPDLARAEIARRVNRPASAVRGWLAEAKEPDAVKAVDVARQRGWIEVETTSEQFRAMNQLVAWIYAGGGISSDTFAPHFSVDGALTLSTLHYLLGWVGLTYRIDSDRPERGTVVVPKEAASLFGRVLSVFGVPTGVKADHEGVGVPAYISTLTTEHQRDFLRVYVLNRGRDLHNENIAGTYLHSLQSETFCAELKYLIESVTAGTATVGSKQEVWISADAVRDLAGGEPIRPALATKIVGGSLTPPTDRAVASTYRKTERPGGYRYLQLYEIVSRRDESGYKLAQQIDDLKRSAGQSWGRGSQPYVKNGVETARNRGWLTPPLESETALALTALIAWMFARGSIDAETYSPAFIIRSRAHQTYFENLAADLGLSYEYVHEAASDRVARPTDGGAVLGRVLSVLGAPLGTKSDGIYLPPAYLSYSPQHARRFIDTWCAHHSEGDEDRQVTVPSRLSRWFADALETLLTEQLRWQTTRVGEYELRMVRDDRE